MDGSRGRIERGGEMKTIAIVNQKGGVGKTTTAVTLGHGMAMGGMRVLVVDLDPQGNVADALGIAKRPGTYEMLIGDPTLAPGLSGRPGLEVVPGNKRTVEAKQILAGMAFREQRLRQALDVYAGVYDVCLLDAAPGVDVLQIGALVACDYFLIPVALDHLAVVGAADALASTASLLQVGAFRGRCLGVLPTMWERRTKESQTQLEVLAGQFRELVWPPVPLDVKAREAPAHGMTLWEYAPVCRALQGAILDSGARVGGYVQVLARLVREVGCGQA